MDNPIKELAADPGAAAERLASLPMVAGVSVAAVVGDGTVGADGRPRFARWRMRVARRRG